jgi:hypothetical protein
MTSDAPVCPARWLADLLAEHRAREARQAERTQPDWATLRPRLSPHCSEWDIGRPGRIGSTAVPPTWA